MPIITPLSTFFVLCLLASLISATNYGLYSKNGESLELLKLSTKALVEGPYAQIEFTQVYKNPSAQAIETEFLFPRTDSSIFHRFEAIFRNKTIVGRIFEKEQAKNMYQKSIQQGHTAAYSERSLASPDVMKIKVGNIPAEESVEIKFSIIQPLELVANKLWGLTLPVVLTERYTGTLSPTSNPSKPTQDNTIPFASFERQSQARSESSTSNPTIEAPIISSVDLKHSGYKEWHVEVDIKTNSPFEFISNPSHDLSPVLSEKASGYSSKIYRAAWDVDLVPNKNFVVYFKAKENQELGIIVAEHQEYSKDYVFLVNFVPDLNSISMETIAQTMEDKEEGFLRLNKLVLESNQQNSRREFIFIVDRSQSMSGQRLLNMKKALEKFFESLPGDSYFNIIGFGSWIDMYQQQSVKNSPEELEKVLKWIQSLDSNYGGTEILAPLHKAVSLPEIENYSRVVILLTDGDVYSPDGVIKIARDNYPKIRFYTVGIGHGVSEYLIKNVAKVGGGMSEFVLDYEDIGDKAGYMIDSAVSEHLKDIDLKVECYDSQKMRLASFSKKVDILLKDQPFKEWVYLEDLKNVSYCTATVQYYNSMTKFNVTKELRVDGFGNAEVTDLWHKLEYDEKMRGLDKEIRLGDGGLNRAELKSQIVGMSTKYQVLSDYTSFFAVLAEDTKKSNETTMKVSIKNLESADCNDAGTCSHYQPTDEGSQRSVEDLTDREDNNVHIEGLNMGLDADIDVGFPSAVNLAFRDYIQPNFEIDAQADYDIDVAFNVDMNVNIRSDGDNMQEEEEEEEEKEEEEKRESSFIHNFTDDFKALFNNFAGKIKEMTGDGFVSFVGNPESPITANIEKVVLKIGHVLDAIALIYDDNTVVHFGGDGGRNHMFELEKGEKIVAISGTYRENVVTSLKFRTSKGRAEEFKAYLHKGSDSAFSFKFRNGEYLASVRASTYHYLRYHVVLEKLVFIVQKDILSVQEL